MRIAKIEPPGFAAEMAPANPSEEAVRLLALRRSTSADQMTEPGPDESALREILRIAARVPDHRKVVPFRFLVFRGDGRARAGDILASAVRASEPQAPADQIEAERRRFLRAPVIVAVIARIDAGHRTPVWEQQMTNGAVILNLLLAASAHGFAAQCLTEWCAYDREVCAGFGLSGEERIAGFIYIGSAAEPPRERQRPDLDAIVSEF